MFFSFLLLFPLFTVITLPVEFDASKRALLWIESNRVVDNEELGMAKDALKWAALTYVIAAVGSIAQLVHLILLAENRSKRG